MTEGARNVDNWIVRAAVSLALGAFVWAFAAANLGEVGLILGAVFGLGLAYLSYEYLTRRAEEKLTRDKWKDYE
jgi:multisubunit Na+/H+ antiporter MnhE subunit